MPDPTPTPAPTPPPPPWIGFAQTDDNGATLTLVATEPLSISNNEFETPDPGQHFTSIEVQECAGGQTLDVNAADWHAVLADSTTLDETSNFERDPHLTLTTLNPGRCERGWVTFELPNSAQITGVHYDGDMASLDWDR